MRWEWKNCIFTWTDGQNRGMTTGIRIMARPARRRLPDGTIPQHQRWAGGPQSYLCATHAPYDFMMRMPESPKQAIPVPLYNLVYHDCVMRLWMMEKISEEEDIRRAKVVSGLHEKVGKSAFFVDFA